MLGHIFAYTWPVKVIHETLLGFNSAHMTYGDAIMCCHQQIASKF